MPGVDPKVMTHRLGIRLGFRPIKQKKRSFTPKRAKAIEAKVEKLMLCWCPRERANGGFASTSLTLTRLT